MGVAEKLATPITTAGDVYETATDADQSIIDHPFQQQRHDPFFRVRFRATGQRLTLPVRDVEHLMRLRHEHRSPLAQHPNLLPKEVLDRAQSQRGHDRGHGQPPRWCGP